MCIFWQFAVNILNGTNSSSQWTAIVIAVKGVEQGPILVN